MSERDPFHDPEVIAFLGGEIRLDEEGQVDDLVLGFDGTPLAVHIERMDAFSLWVGIDGPERTSGDSDHLRVIAASTAPISLTAETEPDQGEGRTIGFETVRRGWIETRAELPHGRRRIAFAVEGEFCFGGFDGSTFHDAASGRGYDLGDVSHWVDPADFLPRPDR